MRFRTDIQILRGIAVLYVVLFHLRSQSFQSGFLGVDVFFVISGFLMAVLYDIKDVKGFFIRRAKRLLPTYFVVIIATLLSTFIINTPNEANQVVSQSIFGSSFLSNIGFWLQNSYFSKSEFNPLLHLWSLGVEIQFYLVVPILAFIFCKIRFSLIFTMLSSMALCFLVLTISPKTAFFMMPLRLWEFLLGYGCALRFTQNGDVKHLNNSWLGGAGLLLVLLIPFLGVDGESQEIALGHPGLISLLVSIATSTVLIFGLPKLFEQNFLSKTMVKLGKYSYSIYLVHFPVIVLYLSEPFSGTVLNVSSAEEWFSVFAITTLLSIALHKFVETRKFKVGIWKLSVIAVLTILVLTLALPWAKSRTISGEEQRIFDAFQDRSAYRCGKLIRIIQPTAFSCNLTESPVDTEGSILLVGNSHADSIKSSFTKVAAQNSVATYFIVQNNPLMAGGLSPQDIVNEAKLKNINHIVLHFSAGAITIERLKEVVSLSLRSAIKVSFIYPVPTWDVHIPKNMYYQLKGSAQSPNQTKQDYLAIHDLFFSEIEKITSENFERFTVVDYLCQSGSVLYKDDDGTPFYFDSSHLTLTGAKALEELFIKVIKRNLTSKSK
jgi:peptidoglycan/LPS O-acetylase OafA/YrhL